MRLAKLIEAVGVALPCLVLATFGLTHPHDLTPATAHHWYRMHLLLIPVFPLLSVCLWWLLRDMSCPLAWLARVLGFVYLTFYGALDVLAGVGNGLVLMRPTRDPALVRQFFAQGNALAEIGVWAFLVACLLTVFLLYRRSGVQTLPGGVLLLVAAISFLSSHIYFPRGVLSMLVMALGFALLSLARSNARQMPQT